MTDDLLHQRFLAVATAYPDRTALTSGTSAMSYEELATRSVGLAQRLVAGDVGEGDVVAVAAEGIDAVVGMLAVCIAGACYLPLNPRYPDDRLRLLVQDAEAEVLLCAARDRERMTATGASAMACDEVLTATSAALPVSGRTAAESPLYVIYTSGSTGRPKGVVVTHHNVARLFSACAPEFGFGPDDVWTMFHSFAFDFSVWEMWGALLHGGRLVLVDHAVRQDPWAFHRLVRSEGVTVLNQTPAAFSQFDRADTAGPDLPALRLVVFGGDRLQTSTLRQWWQRHRAHSPRLVNMYGITETTVHVTLRELGPADLQLATSPIGRPLADLTVSLRGPDGYPVADGEPGEMYVAGDGVAQGYLNRPELTAERFPWLDGRRWYRSGDLAAVRGGELVFLGRADEQLKIRGYRIEPGEVEAAIVEALGIQQVKVLAQGPDEARRLVGFVVSGADFDPADARRRLLAVLPEHLVPAVLVARPELPLTVNGKIDVAALQDFAPPDAALAAPAYSEAAGNDRGPASPEVVLARIWEQVLAVPRVDADDNFFALGGDSLLAVAIVARAADEGLALTVASVLTSQTIRRLATTATAAPLRPADDHQPFALVPEVDEALLRLTPGVQDAFPMTPLQLVMAFHSTGAEGTVVYQNVMSIDVGAPFNAARFRTVLDDLIEARPMLRASLELSGYSRPLQVVYSSVQTPLTSETVLGEDDLQKRSAAWLSAAKSEAPRLAQPPLLTVHVVAAPSMFRICWRIHHAVMDGWSDALFITALVNGYLDGVKPVPHSTALLARHVAETAAAGRSPEHRDFWHRQLRTSTTDLLPRPSSSGSPTFPKRVVQIPAVTAAALRDLAARHGMPVKAFYLAAFGSVIGQHCGTNRTTVGLVVNTRPEDAEATAAIGLFLNTVPVTLRSSGADWAELAREALRAENQLWPYRGLPLAEIVPGAVPPVFGAVFNYVRFAGLDALRRRTDVRVGGLRSSDETEFPLLVNVVDTEDGTELEIGYRTDDVADEVAASVAAGLVDAVNAIARGTEHHRSTEVAAATVHGAVAKVVADTPDAVAVLSGETCLTYSELWQWSGVVARFLAEAGIGPGDFVPIGTGRSAGMVAAALGVLRAGAAYVLLDPAWPDTRIEEMCVRMGAPFVLGGEDVGTISAVSLPLFAGRPGPDDLPVVDGDQPMAVFFTSGSTGRPKGAVIPHRAMMRLLGDQGPYGFGAQTRTLSICALPWDFATLELWAPLTAGGTVHLPMAGVDPGVIQAAVRDGVNTLVLPTGLFHALVDEQISVLDGVSTCLVGGEALAPAQARRFRIRNPEAALFNVYGPVETCGGSACHRVGTVEADAAEVPLGVPVPGDDILVLDPDFVPAAAEQIGELFITGAGLAVGYLGDLAATRNAFVTVRIDGNPVRAYRTGDRGLRGRDGLLRFRGRGDRQLKVRGVRTEPGEIEIRAGEVAGVRQAVVVPVPPESIALFYSGPATASEVERRIRETLPPASIPETIRPVGRFPLTANGKVDREALARLVRRPGAPYRAPAGPADLDEVGSAIVRHAGRILERDDLRLEDDFFASGGNSLHAIRLVAAVSNEFGAEIPLLGLLTARRLDRFADSIRAAGH